MIANFDEFVLKGKQYLRPYLESKGIRINNQGMFRCINPEHPDKNPSAKLYDNTAYCFSCHFSFDIYTAASILDNYPLNGADFITGNVNKILTQFNEPICTIPLTEQQLYLLKVYKVYEIVADFIRIHGNREYAQQRGWTEETCQALCLGSIDFTKLIDYLIDNDYTKEFLDEIDISRRPELFSNSFVFTVFDDRGRPVGFASRRLNWTQGDVLPKYINTASSCPIYKKDETLYGLQVAKKAKVDGTVYVIEGYPDYVTMYQKGIRNAVGIGGTALTYKHLEKLHRYGFKHVILALDSDEAGLAKTESLLTDLFSKQPDMIVSVMQFPAEANEPDLYLQNHDSLDIPPISAFTWKINRLPYDISGFEKCQQLVPIIANDASPLRRQDMIEQLFAATGVAISAIKAEVDSVINLNEGKNRSLLNKTCHRLNHILKDGTLEEKVEAIKLASDTITGITVQDKTHVINEAESIQSCASIFEELIRNEPSTQALHCGFPIMNDLMEGLPKQDCFIAIAGSANVGKSALVFQMAWLMAKQNPDALILLMSIDDTRRILLPRLLALETRMPIRYCRYPGKYLTEAGWQQWHGGKKRIEDLLNTNLILKDSSNGNSIDFAEQFVRYYRDQYPDKPIVFFLDNFHKLKTATADLRVETKQFANTIKNITEKLNCCTLCTVELTKLDPKTRPDQSHIRECVNIDYDAKAIWMCYQELHGFRDRATMVWADTEDTEEDCPKIKPVLEIDVVKNKISDFKGTFYHKFNPFKSFLSEMRANEAMALRETMKKESGRIKNGVLLPLAKHQGSSETWEVLEEQGVQNG